MSPTIYLITLAVIFGTIIVVFGLRFLQASAVAGADAAHTDAYRKLASDAVTAQAGNAATLSAIQSELSEIKTRMTSVEKILKAVE
jgi:Tfp pilus assembly protein PilO